MYFLLILHLGAGRFAWTKTKGRATLADRSLAWPVAAVTLYFVGALAGLVVGGLVAYEQSWPNSYFIGVSVAVGGIFAAPAYLLLRARTVVRADMGPIQASNPAPLWYAAFGASLLAIVGVGVVAVVAVASLVEQAGNVLVTSQSESMPDGVAGVAFGSVVMDQDVAGTVLVAENATLDCGGHQIIGTGSGVGVILADGATVKNCNVVGFNSGVGINRVTQATAENVTVTQSRIGFYLHGGAEAPMIVGSTARKNEIGFLFETGVTNARLEGNTAIDNWRSGYMIDRATDSEFRTNTASGGGSGFWIMKSHRNSFIGNEVTGATEWFSIGIFDSSSENLFDRNVVNGGNVAIAIDSGSHTNHFDQNTLTGNKKGTHVMNGSGAGNSFVGNTASQNSHVGLWDDRAAVNEYTDNTCAGNRDAGSVPDGLCN